MFRQKMIETTKRLVRAAFNAAGFDLIRRKHSHADMAKHLSNVFECHKIDCVLDVGANEGQYGKFLRQLGFRGHIVSFEPVPSAYASLQRSAQKDSRWQCLQLALGNSDETKTMNVYDSSQFSSFLETSQYAKDTWRSTRVAKPVEVRVARLDEIFAGLVDSTGGRNFFLKMDTQGYDKNVFAGALQSLGRIRALQSELSFIATYVGMPQAYDVLADFHAHGFQISGMYPTNRDESSLAIVEYDCVLVKAIAT